MPRRICVTRRAVWLLPQPVRTAPIAITGLVLASMVCRAPSRLNAAPAAFTRAAWCITCSYDTSE